MLFSFHPVSFDCFSTCLLVHLLVVLFLPFPPFLPHRRRHRHRRRHPVRCLPIFVRHPPPHIQTNQRCILIQHTPMLDCWDGFSNCWPTPPHTHDPPTTWRSRTIQCPIATWCCSLLFANVGSIDALSLHEW